MRYFFPTLACLMSLIFASPVQVRAHGDPEIREQRILTVTVSDRTLSGAALCSKAFKLDVPPNTVEILWRVDSPEKANIAFSVLSKNGVIVGGLKDGSKSRIPKADMLTIGNVSGSDNPFVVEIYAHTVQWDH